MTESLLPVLWTWRWWYLSLRRVPRWQYSSPEGLRCQSVGQRGWSYRWSWSSPPPSQCLSLDTSSSETHSLGRSESHVPMKVLDHVMPREKRWGALDSCFELVVIPMAVHMFKYCALA